MDQVYFIKQGVIQLEVYYIMNYSVTFPTAKHSYSRKTNSLVVRRVIRKIGPGNSFGYEEIVNQKPSRIFVAKVVGPKPAQIVISSKEHFIDIINQDDVKNLRAAVKQYSDF